jgi:hypothetical protein
MNQQNAKTNYLFNPSSESQIKLGYCIVVEPNSLKSDFSYFFLLFKLLFKCLKMTTISFRLTRIFFYLNNFISSSQIWNVFICYCMLCLEFSLIMLTIKCSM